MKKLLIIVGPTGSGKSTLAYKIAKEFNFEIINADAFQVYKEINCGINKPSNEMQENIKHHLINNISIFDNWDIKKFKNHAENIIDNSKKNFIIVGGSNLYIHSLINNYNLDNLERNDIFSHLSNDEIYEKLFNLDKDEAIKIGKNNRKYLLRALEIINSKSILKSQISLFNNKKKYKTFLIFINPNRKNLYDKLNKRTLVLFDKKILNEINEIGLSKFKDTNASKAIGYKTIIENNLVINDSIIEKIQQETRNYSKRQVTWIRNKFSIDLETNDYEKDFNKIVLEISNFLKE